MIPKYSINLLNSCAGWLIAKAETVWARGFGHSDLMRSYGEGLKRIAQIIKEETTQCRRCNGILGAPLDRPQHSMDCRCCNSQEEEMAHHEQIGLRHRILMLERELLAQNRQRQDLAALVTRLVAKNPDQTVSVQAYNYLQRHDLCGSILREEQ